MGYLTFPLLYDLNRFKFYKGMCTSTILPASILFNWFGYDNLSKLCLKYNVDMSSIGIKNAFWKVFKDDLFD